MIFSKAETATVLTTTPRFLSNPRFRGVLFKIFSMGCFAFINAIVRYWSGGTDTATEALPVNVLVFFQNLLGTLCFLPWIRTTSWRHLSPQHLSLHAIRVLTAVLGISLWYCSLKVMPIAEGVALSFTGPIFTVMGAWFLLQERLTLHGWLAILLSFSGAFIISRPDLALHHSNAWGYTVLLPLGSALCLAISKLMTRKLVLLGQTPTALATALLLLMTPVSLPLAMMEWQTPSLNHWPWLFILGLLSALSHLSFAKAYQLAEVTFLAPFGFTKFIWGTLIGYLVFSEFPNTWSLWTGLLIILLSLALLDYKMPLYSDAKRFKSS